MLKKLTVQNFALIENAALTFNKEFTVITGETGSGKSILLGALSLILGERANYSVIRNEKQKTIVEGTFDISNYNFESFFENEDLDYSAETIIRREISATGKSRAFINDTPVQLSLLKSLTEKLIYINSQHNTLALKTNTFQLDVLDTLCETNTLKLKVEKDYLNWKTKQKELISTKSYLSEQLKENDYNTFQLEELEHLQLDKVDYDQLISDLNKYENAEELANAFTAINDVINTDSGLLSSINSIVKNFLSLGNKDAQLSDLLTRLQSVKIELDDIGASAEQHLEEIEIDPKELDQLTAKVDQYNSLLKKHNVNNRKELREVYQQLAGKTNSISTLELEINELEQLVNKLEVTLQTNAQLLSDKRKKNAPKVEKEIVLLLEELKLTGSIFSFNLTKQDLKITGIDALSILFTPNKGSAPQPIEKAASGGELSRVMLALQALLSEKKNLPTLIFDEIDTGVSGEVAEKIGLLLKGMGKNMQLFAITHLPQVASKGNHHILVEKRDENSVTNTTLKTINEQQRVEEIAKLMSGTEISEAALENAKKLMQN
ncbi:MAG: DNA repair protein RecN [Lishizhenia sp.]